MHRKIAVVCALYFTFSVLIAGSLSLKGQAPAPQSEKPAAQPAPAPTGAEAGKPDEKSAPAKARAFTEDGKPFLSDRHIATGLTCGSCHGDADPKQAVATDQCLQCHQSFQDLAKKTVDMMPNPHSNHLVDSSDIECSFCHHGHKANEAGCAKCHADMVLSRDPAPTATKTE